MSDATHLAELYAELVAASPEELLAPLIESSGGVLEQARREDVAYRPGRDVHLRFAATVERDGVPRIEGWVVCAGDAPATPLALDGPLGRVAAWRVRDDPVLAGLGSALDPAVVGGLLGDLGLPQEGLTLQLLAYRPQRRAVIAVRTSTHELYLKCVPPESAQALHRRHVACHEAGVPVPQAVGYAAPLGLVVLTPVRGTPLRTLLLAPDSAPPPAAAVADVLAAFAGVDLSARARAPLRQARGHAHLLRSVLPGEAARLDDLLAAVATVGSTAEAEQVVHGDFYDSQLLVRDGAVTGVVDVDGAGLGHPADDAANLLAHLLVLQRLAAPEAHVHRWRAEAVAALSPRHEPIELQRRTAAVLIGLATWPHSRQVIGWQQQTSELLDAAEAVLRHGL